MAHPIALVIGDEDARQGGALQRGPDFGPIHSQRFGDKPVTAALAHHGDRVHGTRRTSAEPPDASHEEVAQVIGHAGRAGPFSGEDLLDEQWNATTSPMDVFGALGRWHRADNAGDLRRYMVGRQSLKTHVQGSVTLQHIEEVPHHWWHNFVVPVRNDQRPPPLPRHSRQVEQCVASDAIQPLQILDDEHSRPALGERHSRAP